MAECEICGAEGPLTTIQMGSGPFDVCDNCTRYGKVIENRGIPNYGMPKPITRANKEIMSEELVVEDFAKLVSQARQRKGLKQDELAQKINEKAATIHAIESGHRQPQLKVAKKLERFLGIQLIE